MLGYVLKMLKHLNEFVNIKCPTYDRDLDAYYRIEYNYISNARLMDMKNRLGIQDHLGKWRHEDDYSRR